MIYFFKRNKIYNINDTYQYVIVKRGILHRTIAKIIGEPIIPSVPYPDVLGEFIKLNMEKPK